MVFTFTAIFITIALALFWGMKNQNEMIKEGSKRYFQQSVKMTQTVLDYELDRVYSLLNAKKFTPQEIEQIKSHDLVAMQQRLNATMPPSLQFSAVIPLDSKEYVTGGVFLYDIDKLVNQIRDKQTITADTELIFYEIGQTAHLFMVATRGIVDSRNGEVVGLYATGIRLSNNIRLINDIKNNADLDAVALYYNDKQIVANSDAKALQESALQDRYEQTVFCDAGIGYRAKLEFGHDVSALNIKMMIANDAIVNTSRDIYKDILFFASFVIAVMVVLLLLINKFLLAPIERLKIYAKEFLESNRSDTGHHLQLNIKEYRQLADYLQELFMQLLSHQEELVLANKKIESDYKVIQNLNNSLEDKVAQKTQELQLQLNQITQKDRLLQEQAKLAAMGEMIDAVAHQWKTPLTSISYYVQNVEFLLEDETLDTQEIRQHLDGIMAKVDHLLDTMDSFREFFRPVSVIEAVSLKKLIDETLLLMQDELLKNQIETEFVGEDMKIFLIPNEFKHILINLINNSKAAFAQNDIAKRVIYFEVRQIDRYEAMIKIEDTAGGIAKEALGRIFEPHFTTKKDSGGTGIGLYVSKLILDKIGAKVEVYNTDHGACFEIRVYNACGI